MTQVLVAGGGPVGLAAAVELGRRGVECVVVEPRATVSHARPRCKTVNVRTMEHLRRWGLADRLRARAPLPVDFSTDVVFCTSLVGRELSRFTGVLGLSPQGDRFPEVGQQAPQYVLEELLREVAVELDTVTLELGSRVTGLVQDADGVTVRLDDGESIRCAYVLGCDGPRSSVRACVGVDYVGEQALRPNFGMVFRAPGLAGRVPHGPAVQYWTVNPDAPALLGPLDPAAGTWWIIAFGVDRGTGEREGASLIDAAAGPPVGADVLSTDPWTARMQLVDSARVGRVFLAGDAAHLNPPFGGHGLNTGIGDAVDLGWKLAAVLQGWGGPGLLESYEAERRPVQDLVVKAASENMRTLSGDLVADELEADTPAGAAARRRRTGGSRTRRAPSSTRSTSSSTSAWRGRRSWPTAPVSGCPTRGCPTVARSTTSSGRGSRCWCRPDSRLPLSRTPARAAASRSPSRPSCPGRGAARPAGPARRLAGRASPRRPGGAGGARHRAERWPAQGAEAGTTRTGRWAWCRTAMAVLPSTTWRSVDRPREPTTMTPALRAEASASQRLGRGPWSPAVRAHGHRVRRPSFSSSDRLTCTGIRSRWGRSAAAAALARSAPSDPSWAISTGPVAARARSKLSNGGTTSTGTGLWCTARSETLPSRADAPPRPREPITIAAGRTSPARRASSAPRSP